jgi:hypothetical protein
MRRRPRWDPDWVCPLCDVLIFGRHDACKKCKTPKVKKGDWVCRRDPCIAEFNFASRDSCRKCSQPKPTACVCSEPRFASIYKCGNSKPLGDCYRCLLTNPTPWYITILDEQEEAMRQSAGDVPQEHWRYRLSVTGRYQTHNTLGLGELVPMHCNEWLFRTRGDVEAELKAQSCQYDPRVSGLRVVDGRKLT